ncbi:metal ABC transporter substrate-binding protein [Pelotomaculum terephthalicicum JT]|uniref:metal ABC transporter substrate-binding protein n=1 Tax=Pelotomaculum TaxID=191373 RepID=UPI0009D5A703|nr:MULTISPECIES: metal ABC transporter substrate-binding protein [Pelotomaculum]MCG9969461.1 metal ABC transporter substrate-binding protein [Pelotomaculum terephthalicicum JT]OPX89349.1 MAG: High-affinity zinc uptake system binding-protein ZnuA precursor [Pelotomaculum sp. PtaB.Bin117]
MRKPAILLITAVLLVTGSVFLSACQGQTQTAPDKSATDKTLTIVTSFYPMYIAAINVAKDVPGVKVVNMTPPVTGCLHDYQLKPDDLKTLSEAQIFVVNGAGMESFMDKVVSQLPDLKIVDASKGIPLIKGDGEEGDNPHLWVSISNAIQQVNNIGLQLAALDPEHAAQYSANTTAYADQLEALRVKMHQTLDGAQKRDIITFHEAFPYFAREFNLNIAAVIEREPGSEPSAAELADTIEIIEKSQIKALFAEPQYSATAAETIARETGAQIYILDPAVTGDMEPDAYLKIMETNMKTLEEALN